ncbi:hypothetical protein FSARC_1880 [Fusarium sarcochroum]|uniref:Nudix hydrolase domain-containing protein n=1 Tax=Fusarium sarcochroum TaxID=1208366 RepID=A0A8H4U863_9HYPO|nr:hypothetical protein FSARC_1880 [Fusarium sarcochroum]
MDFTVKSLRLSDQFVISCGTVAMDVKKSKVLLVHWRKTNEYFLPKGRKDRDERLEQTALRETFEETGIRAKLLPVDIDTLATIPSSSNDEDYLMGVTEPIAMSQRLTNKILKVIFWYVAEADSTATPVHGTQQENEEFDVVWEGFDDVTSTITFDDDRRIARAAIAAVHKATEPASSRSC